MKLVNPDKKPISDRARCPTCKGATYGLWVEPAPMVNTKTGRIVKRGDGVIKIMVCARCLMVKGEFVEIGR